MLFSQDDLLKAQEQVVALEQELAQLRKNSEQPESSPLERYVQSSAETRDALVEKVIADLEARGIEARSVPKWRGYDQVVKVCSGRGALTLTAFLGPPPR